MCNMAQSWFVRNDSTLRLYTPNQTFSVVLEKRSWKYSDPVGTQSRELCDKYHFTPLFTNNLVVQIHCLCHSCVSGDNSTYDSQLIQPVPEEMRPTMVVGVEIRILQYLFWVSYRMFQLKWHLNFCVYNSDFHSDFHLESHLLGNGLYMVADTESLAIKDSFTLLHLKTHTQ